MKRLPWISLALLLVCYASFGWYLSSFENQPTWMQSACNVVFSPMMAQPLWLKEPGGSEPRSPTASTPEQPESEPSPNDLGQQEGATSSEAPEEPSPAARSPEESQKPPTQSNPKPPPRPTTFLCGIVIKHNLSVGLLAVGWILISSMAFISPLSSFNGFLSRWFKSDTIAFGTLFLLAGLAVCLLYWLQVTLQILTILAADALARIDIQTLGLSGGQAFWILTLVSLIGLTLGWLVNGIMFAA